MGVTLCSAVKTLWIFFESHAGLDWSLLPDVGN